MSHSLPDRASLEQLQKRAKDLLAQWRLGDISRVAPFDLQDRKPSLSSAQLVVAREHGFDSWPKMRHSVAARQRSAERLCELVLIDSVTPFRVDAVRKLLKENPELPRSDFYLACLCGEDETVRRGLSEDSSIVNSRGGTANRHPLLYVCFSGILRNQPERRKAFRSIVSALLEAGADPNVAFDSDGWPLSALYGAVAVAKDPEIAKMLRRAGADLNDGETCYHGVEEPGLRVLREVFEGADAKSRIHALFRKLDFEDIEGRAWLLDHGVEPTLLWEDGQVSSLHQAIRRGRSIETIRLLLERGADPKAIDAHGRTPYADAMRAGRIDVAGLLGEYGAATAIDPRDAYLAAIAAGERPEPVILDPDRLHVLCEAAWDGDLRRVVAFLDAGLPVDGAPGRDTPIHNASWMGRVEVVRELIRRGAALDRKDPQYDAMPLGWCCHGSIYSGMQGHVDVARLLLEAGAPRSESSEWPREGDASPEVRKVIRQFSG